MGKERNSDQWFALWALLGLCAVAALGVTIWIGVDLTLRNSGSPNPAPSVVHPSSPVSSNVIPRDPAARRAELAMIPAPGTRPAMVPTVSGPRVSLAISPVLIQGAATSDPMRIAMHPSLAPPAGVKPATEPVDASTLSPGTYAYAVNLELQRKFVMSMCTDQQGNLWVGTEGGGVQRFDPSAPKYQQWTQFTTKDGLGDDNGYAIACDQQNRIWAGHLNHGVSVFNGQKWQNYEVVAGLSRPDTLAGPLGERIFHITICPADGDVWMASSCGLARYSIKNDAWSYITRADGLPSDQANSMAFDPQGNIYVATQCDGIAMADASDNYKHWRQVTGPDEEPTQPTGDGLPTNLMNDILVAKDGTVYAATDVGLAWSKDNGITWKYVRGKDWAEKVRRKTYELGPEIPVGNAILSEDYCTCLAEVADGGIVVGHREAPADLMDSHFSRIVSSIGGLYANGITTAPATVGYYGDGVKPALALVSANTTASSVAAPTSVSLPLGARLPSVAELDALVRRISALPQVVPRGVFFGEDWATQGDWMGRYGRRLSYLFATHSPRDDVISSTKNYLLRGFIGPNASPGDSLRHWLAGLSTTDHRTLWDPICGSRRQGEWDDHGEVYPPPAAGPDIWASLTIAAGIHDVSIYFVNDDGHRSTPTARRDFVVELLGATQSGSVLARCRVCDFYGGVYKTFRVIGPATYQIHVIRSHSLNAICSGIFVDLVNGPKIQEDNMALPCIFAKYIVDEPGMDVPMPVSADPWNALRLNISSRNTAAFEGVGRKLAFRGACREANVSVDWLNYYRWNLRLWSLNDRRAYQKTMDDGWEMYLKVNPGFAEMVKSGKLIP